MIPPVSWQPGDVVAVWSNSLVGRTISWGTAVQYRLRPGPSHVAIVCETDRWGPTLVESTMLNAVPCLVRGKQVAGAQAHLPADVLDNVDGRFEVYRLLPLWSLSGEESRLLAKILLEHFVGKGLDYDTRGALVSGTNVLRRLPFFNSAALRTVFCSELVHCVLQRLHRLPAANPAYTSPASLIRRMVRLGVYEQLEVPTYPRLAA